MKIVDDNYMFLRTMDDLRHKTRENHFEPYDLMRGCGLVRHLLTDENPLAYIVNKPFRLKFRFRIDNEEIDLNASFSFKNFTPQAANYVDLSKDEFLSRIAMQDKGQGYSINEILRHAMYILGGVHSSKPKDSVDINFSNIDDQLGFVAMSKYIAIHSICLVVVAALKPLEEEIQKIDRDR